MEQSKLYCTLTDSELADKAEQWIDKLIKSGGKDFIMCVPARPNEDTDLILAELHQRFLKYCYEYAALKAKGDKLARALRSLSLSVQAHPHYTGIMSMEWGDMVESAEQYLAEWKGEEEPAPGAVSMDDVIGFAEWAAEIAFFDNGHRLWELLGEGEAINGQFRFTTKEFFEIYKRDESAGEKEVSNG